MARATADRAVVDGRLLPIRAAKIVGMLDDALVASRARAAASPMTRPVAREHPRRARASRSKR